MSSRSGGRTRSPALEAVQPAHLWIPDRIGSHGAEATELAALVGRPLDTEQELAVDAMLSYGKGGRWAALESVIIEARQNGKTAAVLLPVTLYDLFLLPPDRIVWTAHLFRTARDAFNDFDAVISGTPFLSSKVKKTSYANGEEYIELKTGAKLEFLARSKGGGRGLGGKRIVMDEALFLAAEAMAALLPTLSARSMTGDPQINYGSSAGLATSDQLRTLRNRGRKGGDPSLIWVEFCAPGSWVDPPCDAGVRCTHQVEVEGCALDNEEYWRLANHVLGRRMSYDYVRSERRALPPREFGRERLGWWDETELTLGIFSAEMWRDLKDEESQITGRPAFAIDMTPDRSKTAIGAAGRRKDGRLHIEVVEHREGSGWVLDRMDELKRRWRPVDLAVDGRSPAASLVPELRERGWEPNVTTASDMAQACGGLYDKVLEAGLRHLGDPLLSTALGGATWRTLGDSRAFDRKNSTSDISPLVAVTLAAHAFVSRPSTKAWAVKR